MPDLPTGTVTFMFTVQLLPWLANQVSIVSTDMKRRLATALAVIAMLLGVVACTPAPGSSPGASRPAGGGYGY